MSLKQYLRIIAIELNKKTNDRMTVSELNNVIMNGHLYKSNPNQVTDLTDSLT